MTCEKCNVVMSKVKEENAICRGCGKTLTGKPYYMGKSAYLDDGKKAKVNFYGGFVCSYNCDYKSSKELENSMPGAGVGKYLSLMAAQSIKDNWGGGE